MSKSVNQCLIIGNVGKDPETRTLDNGVKVSTFSVATSTGGYKKQDGTDVPEKTSWHNIVAWRGIADIAEKYIHKGDKVTVFGTISYREYEKDGIKRYITDILAYDIVLEGRSKSSSSRPAITESDAPQQSDFPPMQNVGDDDQLPF